MSSYPHSAIRISDAKLIISKSFRICNEYVKRLLVLELGNEYLVFSILNIMFFRIEIRP